MLAGILKFFKNEEMVTGQTDTVNIGNVPLNF